MEIFIAWYTYIRSWKNTQISNNKANDLQKSKAFMDQIGH